MSWNRGRPYLFGHGAARLKKVAPDTRSASYRCSLPGLAGFTKYRREGTDVATISRD